MDRKKYLLFFSIISVCLGFLFFNSVKTFIVQKWAVRANQSWVFHEGDYKVGTDLSSGTYDIAVIEGEVEIFGMNLFAEDQLVGLNLDLNNVLQINGTGEVKLNLSNPQKMQSYSDKYTLTSGGWYNIGSQLTVGLYEICYTSNDENSTAPFLQVMSSDRGTVHTSMDIQKKIQTVELKNNKWLYLFLTKQSDTEDIEVTLTRVN